jgi:hypothetical protein
MTGRSVFKFHVPGQRGMHGRCGGGITAGEQGCDIAGAAEQPQLLRSARRLGEPPVRVPLGQQAAGFWIGPKRAAVQHDGWPGAEDPPFDPAMVLIKSIV